jgi:hypothetical protein
MAVDCNENFVFTQNRRDLFYCHLLTFIFISVDGFSGIKTTRPSKTSFTSYGIATNLETSENTKSLKISRVTDIFKIFPASGDKRWQMHQRPRFVS